MFKRSVTMSVMIAFLFLGGGTCMVRAQTIDLHQAIMIAQQQSLSYKIAANRLQSSVWDYQNFQISNLPMLSLDGTLPSYSRSISKITLPSGEDTFVNQNQAYNSLNLTLNQNIVATGGVLSFGSSLNRIDVLGKGRSVTYSAVPAFISYTQSNLSYNEFRWLKKMEPLRAQIADKNFIYEMEQISAQTVQLYFDLLSAESRSRLSAQNVSSTDSLLFKNNQRFRLGTVAQSDILQLRLNLLNARKQKTQDSMEVILAKQSFSRFLNLPKGEELRLIAPENVVVFPIMLDEAIQMAVTNSQQILDYRLRKLEAEKNLAKIKSESNLRFNLQANLGVSNVAGNIPGLLNHLQNQQNVSLGFSLPILDWGSSKTKKLRAEADLVLVANESEQGQRTIEQEVGLQVSNWYLLEQQINIVLESRRIAVVSFRLERQRYVNGTISLNDLNVAQTNMVNSIVAFNDILRRYWETYYSIRQLTLFDFKGKNKIIYHMH